MVGHHYKCQNEECKASNKTASYGYTNGKPQYCAKCAKKDYPDMVNLVSKKCRCGKVTGPIFGFLSDKKGVCCDECKEDGMVDVKHPLCACEQRAYYGITGTKKPTHCSEHREPEMVNVVNKRCPCGVIPSFGYDHDRTRLCCIKCKKPDMVDLANDKCQTCGVTAIFGYVGRPPIRCGEHKESDMTDLKHWLCIVCGKRACFGYKDDAKPTYCNVDKKDRMIDIVHPRCSSCNLFRVHKKNGLCGYCNPESMKRQKTSEMTLLKFLDDNKVEHVHNKSIGFECGSYRPDFLIDCGTHYIVVENDENQHETYEQECEIVRMINIEQALGLRTIFLRYNPDAYKIDGETTRIYKTTRMPLVLNRVNHYRDYEKCEFQEGKTPCEYLYYNDKHLHKAFI